MKAKKTENIEIKSKEDFLSCIRSLADAEDHWHNPSTKDFLEALVAWLEDSDGYYNNFNIEMNTDAASWQYFADAVRAATVYG